MRAHQLKVDEKPLLLNSAKVLMRGLKTWTTDELSTRMKLSISKAQQTFALHQQWGLENNQKNAAPALFAYIGEAFKALDADSCTVSQSTYLRQNLFILSGLYGILGAFDQIEPYRLEMAQRGVLQKDPSLYVFWQKKVEKVLLDALENEEFILNLASTEYSELIQDKTLRCRMVTPHFFERKDKQLKSVSVFSKQARGAMARWCAQNAVDAPIEIQKFTQLGYVFVAAQSSATDWLFIR